MKKETPNFSHFFGGAKSIHITNPDKKDLNNYKKAVKLLNLQYEDCNISLTMEFKGDDEVLIIGNYNDKYLLLLGELVGVLKGHES